MTTQFNLERNNHAKPVNITISTKVPSKWRFMDTETQEVWQWDEKHNTFVRAYDHIIIKDLVPEIQKLSAAIHLFLNQYDKEMEAPTGYDRGAKIATIMNTLFSAVLMWDIELQTWGRSKKVQALLDETYKPKE